MTSATPAANAKPEAEWPDGNDVDGSLLIHKIVMLQTLSILVKRGEAVTGLLRLSDLFDEIVREMKKEKDQSD